MSLEDNANFQETASKRNPNKITLENPSAEGGLNKTTVDIPTCDASKMAIVYETPDGNLNRDICKLIPEIVIGVPYETEDLALVSVVLEKCFNSMGVDVTFATIEKGGGG